jgi:hypothetical protein
VIVAFEEYNLCDFLLIFKLFPIGYGPTPSKRKGIVLKQEIVKGLAYIT